MLDIVCYILYMCILRIAYYIPYTLYVVFYIKLVTYIIIEQSKMHEMAEMLT